jgi:hypothetical protein
VKNTFRILGVAVWVAFCCLANRTANPVASLPTFPGNSEQEISFSTIAKSPLYHAFPTGGPEKNFSNNGGASIVKTTAHKHFLVLIWVAELRYASAFSQYVSISRTFLIRFRKADVIFPFHYFW